MPEPTSPAAAPGQPPSQSSQPPFGSSPATGPTPNKGYEAQGIQRLGLVIKQMTELFSMLGPGSEVGKDVLKALNTLSKHVPPGSVTPAAEKNGIEQMALKNAQQSQQMQQLKSAAGGQGGQPAAGGAPPQMPKAA